VSADQWTDDGQVYKLGTKGLLAWWAIGPTGLLAHPIVTFHADFSVIPQYACHCCACCTVVHYVIFGGTSRPAPSPFGAPRPLARAGLVLVLLAVGVNLIISTSQLGA
jgi:hypothetical protein